MADKDYYETLGVSRDASQDEIPQHSTNKKLVKTSMNIHGLATQLGTPLKH